MNDFPALLKEARLASGHSRKSAAAYLSQFGKPLTFRAVQKWENGDTQPNAVQFLDLCRLYGVQDIGAYFTPGEAAPLNEEGREKVRDYTRVLIASGLYSRPQPAVTVAPPPRRTLRVYDMPVSAGVGEWLDESTYTEIEADETVPATASYGLRIKGDSMQPRFQDGQAIWVQAQPMVEPGEIGIFFFGGQAYCKKLCLDEDGTWLVSLNQSYAPIQITEADDLRVFGKVVG